MHYKRMNVQDIDAHTAICRRQLIQCEHCGHECLRFYMETHQEMDVQCLRKQLDASQSKATGLESVRAELMANVQDLQVAASVAVAAAATPTQWTNWTNARERRHLALGVKSAPTPSQASTHIFILGAPVFVRCEGDIWRAAQIVLIHNKADMKAFRVNMDGWGIMNDAWASARQMIHEEDALKLCIIMKG